METDAVSPRDHLHLFEAAQNQSGRASEKRELTRAIDGFVEACPEL